jgi:hypothetical protein
MHLEEVEGTIGINYVNAYLQQQFFDVLFVVPDEVVTKVLKNEIFL